MKSINFFILSCVKLQKTATTVNNLLSQKNERPLVLNHSIFQFYAWVLLMKKIKNLKHLLGEKLIVLSLELLNDVFVIEQFLDGAVGLAELFLD